MKDAKSLLPVTAQPDSSISLIDELFSRNPLTLSEEEILQTAKQMTRLLRSEIAEWNKEQERAKAEGRKPSGSRVKKQQRLSAERQEALAEVGDFLTEDPFDI